MRGIIKTSIIVVVVLAILAVTVMAVNTYIHRIRAGWIIQKTFSPAHTSRYVTYMRVNKIMIPQWHTVHHNDRWIFTIEYGDKRASWDVRESTYDSYDVGDWFELEEVIAN
jgi:hypothetical protein